MSADVRAGELLQRLPGGPVIGAEVGVWRGDMSAALLRAWPDLTLLMVDPWVGRAAATDAYLATGDRKAKATRSAMNAARRRAERAVRFSGDRARIIRAKSLDAAKDIEDGSLDFVFLDADHSYEAVKADIAAWTPKIKGGGVLSGHDYQNERFGVAQAVDEAAALNGWNVELAASDTWFARLR